MNNKGFIQVVTICLLLASIYQLSFTFKTNSVEKDAVEAANSLYPDNALAADSFAKAYLDSMGPVNVYNLGIAEFTYQECKENELNLGLDLQGGMNVTLEVETPAVIRNLSGKTSDPSFNTAFNQANEAYNGQQNFVDLLASKYSSVKPDGKLAPIFYRKELENDLPNGYKSSNEEIYDYLKKESESAISNAFEIIGTRIDKFGVAQPNLQRLDNGRILVELPGVDDPERVRRILQSSAKLEFWNVYYDYKGYDFLMAADKIIVGENALEQMEDTTVSASVVEETAVDSTDDGSLDDGSLGGSLAANDSIDPDSPALQKSIEEIRAEAPVSSLVVPSPALYNSQNWEGASMVGVIAIKDTAQFSAYLKNEKIQSIWPSTLVWKFGFKPMIMDNGSSFIQLYALKSNISGEPALAGDVISDARPSRQEDLTLAVSMTMNQEGTKAWKRITADASTPNPKECVAIVLDNLVYSAPRVQGEIPNGSSVITGNFDQKEAADLSNILKAGKLDAPVRIAGEATVGASLGEDSIRAGIISLAVGFVLVIIFMMLYYGKAGFYADIALLANLVFIIGVLAGLHAALTLPGMAGLVLTIGMAVDANVLIFERVREELQAGKSFKTAIKEGYAGAYSSIIDANITTIIAGIILWVLGKGPVMGFAVILVIGILSSLFTSIFLTRLFIDRDIAKNRETSFYTGFSKKLGIRLNQIDWDFIGKRKLFYIISGVIITAGIISLATRGVSLGVDFKGGWSYVVEVEDVKSGDLRNALNAALEDANNEVKTYGTNNQFKVTTSYEIESKDSMAAEKVQAAVIDAFKDYGFTEDNIKSTNKVGPTIAADIKARSAYAIAFAIIGMFLYILARFRNVGFSLGATMAIFHDVMIVFSLYSILWGVLPFELSIDQAFIAAILTVVGYSINDTVVVFDRVREFLGLTRNQNEDVAPVINRAINTTLSRTLITSLTTLLVILILFIFGGEGLAGFTFALLIGVAVGTYSSVCIATPIVVDYIKRFKKK